MASCYRTLGYFVGTLHMILFGGLLISLMAGYDYMIKHPAEILAELTKGNQGQSAIIKDMDEQSEISVINVIMILSVIESLFHIFMAILLIVGINKRRPGFVRSFRVVVQLFLVLKCIYSLHSAQPFTILFIAFFAAEVWITYKYSNILAEEIRQEGMSSLLIVTVARKGQTATDIPKESKIPFDKLASDQE